MNAAHCAGPGSHSHAAMPRGEGGDEPQGQLAALGLEKGFDAGFGAAQQKRRKSAAAHVPAAASSMLGALTHAIWRWQTKESAP